ncbi:hypothetical protein SARC_09684, partial [Sphaeroforma arctica JP610]
AESDQSIDLQRVTDQVGTMIISRGGDVLSSSGDLDGPNIQSTMIGILHDTGCVLDGAPLKRVCLTYDTFEYVLTLGGERGDIYVVKRAL